MHSSSVKKDVSIQKTPKNNGDSGAETRGILLNNCTANCSIPVATYARTNGHDTTDLSLRLPAD